MRLRDGWWHWIELAATFASADLLVAVLEIMPVCSEINAPRNMQQAEQHPSDAGCLGSF